jgi:hypothetical protein
MNEDEGKLESGMTRLDQSDTWTNISQLKLVK